LSSCEELVSSKPGSPSLDFALGSATLELTVPEPERLGAVVVESSIGGSDEDGTEVTGGRPDSSVVTAAEEPQFLHGAATVAGEV
jgi:hypothetical protein